MHPVTAKAISIVFLVFISLIIELLKILVKQKNIFIPKPLIYKDLLKNKKISQKLLLTGGKINDNIYT
jgi:hypothetical protein